MILGVDEERLGTVSVLPTNIVRGKFDLSRYGTVLGKELADNLQVTVGDKILVYSFSNLEKLQKAVGNTNAELPVAEEYTIRGLFDVGYNEYDNSIMIKDSAQQAAARKFYDFLCTKEAAQIFEKYGFIVK